MSAVSSGEAVSYGMELIATSIKIVIAAAIPLLFGYGMFRNGSELAFAASAVISVIVLYSGTLGMFYKVIADAVSRGNKEAS